MLGEYNAIYDIYLHYTFFVPQKTRKYITFFYTDNFKLFQKNRDFN